MAQELKPEQAAPLQKTGDPTLAPAGAPRNEQMAQRKDKLAEEAERLAHARQSYAIRKEAFQEEREIQQFIGKNTTTGQEDYFAGENLDHQHFGYRLVQATYPRDTPGKFFSVAKGEGFEAVRGDEINLTNGRPVISSMRYRQDSDFDNAIRVGDCVLVQMDRFRFDAWNAARDLMNQQVQAARQGYGVSQQPGTIVHQDMDDPIVKRVLAAGGEAIEMAPVATMARQALAKSIATQQHHEQIRQGTVGQPVGR